jgi:hypothetical protein
VVDAIRRDVGRRIEFAPGDRLLKRAETLFDMEVICEFIEASLVRIDGTDHLHAVDGDEVGNLVFGHNACSKNE